MKQLSLIISFAMISWSYVTAQTADWVKGAGTSGDDKINSVAVDGNGNTFVGGQMAQGQITFGSDNLNNSGSSLNGFLAKYNSSGTAQWGILFSNAANGEVTDVTIDGSGDVYVTGTYTDSLEMNPKGTSNKIVEASKFHFTKSFYVAKYNTNGILQWRDFMQSVGEWDSRGIAVDAAGNVYVTGSGYDNLVNSSETDSASDVTSATESPFLAKWNSSGNFQSVIMLRTAADNNGAKAYDVSAGADGRIVMVGSTADTLRFGSTDKTPDLTNTQPDVFVAKFDAQLNNIWGYIYGGEDEDEALSVATDNASKIWITGSMQNSWSAGGNNLSSNGGTDILVALLDSNGTVNKAFNLGGASNDVGRAIAVTSSGDCWVTGDFSGSSVDFDPGSGTENLNGGTGHDMFLASYESTGDYRSAMAIGDAGGSAEIGQGIAFANNLAYVSGLFSSSNAEFNPNGSSLKITNQGDRDAVVARYNTVSCPVGNAGSIKGSNGNLCLGDDGIELYVDPVSGATSYIWSFQGDPSVIVSGLGTNRIIIRVTNDQTNGITVTPTDGNCNGNPASLNITVNNPPTWDNINKTDPTCGQNNGSISVSANGTGPFSYLWSNGDKDSNPDSLLSGAYNVTVTDSSTGCKVDSLITLSDNGAPMISNEVLVNPKCNGGNDGMIDITLTGGTPPLKFTWSNGDTTEDASGLETGGHRVVIMDAQGCQNSKIFYLGENRKLFVSKSVTKPTTCGVPSGRVNSIVSGGVRPYSYRWSNTDTTANISNLPSGMYKLVVTDSNGCKDSTYADVSDAAGPSINLDSISQNDCQTTNGAVYISSSAGAYTWSNNTNLQNLTGVSAGFYTVTATSGSCKGVRTFEVMRKMPEINQVCMVTVDDSSKKNLCAFEKGPKGTIDKYLLYHESWQAGVFLEVGQWSVDSISYWIDPLSDPQLKPWRYALRVLDKCGATSELSIPHRTVHLVVEAGAPGVNTMRWTNYVGFSYDTVYIERYTDATDWVVIDSVPANTTTYTDATAPQSDKSIQYAITINHPNGCTATRANSKNFNSSRSNRSAPPSVLTPGDTSDTNKPKPSIIPERELGLGYMIYPNPNGGSFKLKGAHSSEIISLEVFSVAGSKLQIHNSIEKGQNQNEVELIDAKPGLHIAVIEDDTGTHRLRFVIQ